MPPKPEQPSTYALIAIPIPVKTVFTYLIPPKFISSAETGRRALVPFGKRILTGFIVGITDSPGDVPAAKIKAIHDIADDVPVFDNHMLEFCRWTAEYYMCSLGEVLKTAMPHGTMIKSKVIVRLEESPPELVSTLSPFQQTVLDTLAEKKKMPLKTLERAIGKNISAAIRALEKKGYVTLKTVIETPSVRPKTERYVKITTNDEKSDQDVPRAKKIPTLPKRAKQQIKCLAVLEKHPDGIPLSELLERYSFSRGVVNALVDSGHAEYMEIEITRRSKLLDQENVKADHPLTSEQKRSFREIMKQVNAKTPKHVLLKGVTGSGKTRVYIEIVKEMIKQDRGAIILVPEISLTPQTTRFFTSVFPDNVAVLHSAMSPGERYDMWRHIHDGTYNIVIGPRSAIFAPVQSPGIIIVDEEHDSSYKQSDTAPRYNARDIAVVRAGLLGIPAVFGSATPSMESWHNAKTGKYVLSELNNRVEAKPLPEIVTVNMKDEKAAGNYSALSLILREELEQLSTRGEKAIILINRRGYASSVHCKKCGYILACPNCAVGLTWHSSKGLAVCHVCGHNQLILENCPECGETDLQYRGMGTQRVEKELAMIAGEDAIVRMDSDTTSAHDGHFKLLTEFRTSEKSSILLGTQMVAKGHDIHEVTLVGIISADLSLFIPDFRAFERTFQLVTQVAGRAGRGDNPGKVILQTYDPDNHAISAASRQDFESFAEIELAGREELDFPPFSRLILIELQSEQLTPLKYVAQQIADFLAEHLPEKTELLGPEEAPIARRKGKHRQHILIKTRNPNFMKPLIESAVEAFARGKEDVFVDVDPVDLV
jgi:primosomal protein N' (replication factor Y) (superfamily II helicase)